MESPRFGGSLRCETGRSPDPHFKEVFNSRLRNIYYLFQIQYKHYAPMGTDQVNKSN